MPEPDYVSGPYSGIDHGAYVNVIHEDECVIQLDLDSLDALFDLWRQKEEGDGRKPRRVLLHRAPVGYIAEALYRLPVECRYHGDDFGRLGYEPNGEPRCDSCKPAWWRRRALTLLAGDEVDHG